MPGFYERALQVKPDFHVALANLANAMKDMVCLISGFGYEELTLLYRAGVRKQSTTTAVHWKLALI